jgi:hypothetical protein
MSAACPAFRARTPRRRAWTSCGPICKRVLELCVEERADLRERLPKFIGVQQIEVA